MTASDIVALVMAGAALIGVGIQFWKGWAENRRDNGDAAESVAQATSILLEPLKTRVAELEARTAAQEAKILMMQKTITGQQHEITELRAGVMLLTNQIIGLGHTPIYKPSPHSDDPSDTG